ncbi:unnamed protein product [Brachionus calyciflorus]|uniref:Inosine/uridine-preferring nucleoside hydrolase domain-containing protein n=1 Tax=Brachionus calyciflorus TaxID=104777 RepID=A0A814KFY3_9BILA|nr:unnamed protein product [Brachionus calyciflorus]
MFVKLSYSAVYILLLHFFVITSSEVTDSWVDCDPGNDDVFALLLTAHSKQIKLLGISTVAGNQDVKNATDIALMSMNLFGLIHPTNKTDIKEDISLSNFQNYGLECPLVIGASKPLLKNNFKASYFDNYGLNSLNIPLIPKSVREYVENLNSKFHFTKLMYDSIKNNSKKVTIIALGPLTNIALLIINYPDVINYVEKIVIMGGAVGFGNVGQISEFNIKIDPEAAAYVFDSGLPVYMVPLELTHTALITPKIQQAVKSLSNNYSNILSRLLMFYAPFYKTTYQMDDPPLHDPCAVAYVVDPSLFECRLFRVDVETMSSLSYGQTICDFYNETEREKNVFVCLKMNVEKFWDLMLDAIRSIGQISPAN